MPGRKEVKKETKIMKASCTGSRFGGDSLEVTSHQDVKMTSGMPRVI
jgi:hypothetical protein